MSTLMSGQDLRQEMAASGLFAEVQDDDVHTFAQPHLPHAGYVLVVDEPTIAPDVIAADIHQRISDGTPVEAVAEACDLTVAELYARWEPWATIQRDLHKAARGRAKTGTGLCAVAYAEVWSSFVTADAACTRVGKPVSWIVATELVNRGAGVMPGRGGHR